MPRSLTEREAAARTIGELERLRAIVMRAYNVSRSRHAAVPGVEPDETEYELRLKQKRKAVDYCSQVITGYFMQAATVNSDELSTGNDRI